MYHKFLIPIDLAHADRGRAAIDTAKSLSDGKPELILVSVLEDLPSFVDAYLDSNLTETFRKNARQALEDIANSSGAKTDVVVAVGRPATAILEVAEEKGPDLIIIASHRPGLQDYFMGSTASRVVSHAECPVLVER